MAAESEEAVEVDPRNRMVALQLRIGCYVWQMVLPETYLCIEEFTGWWSSRKPAFKGSLWMIYDRNFQPPGWWIFRSKRSAKRGILTARVAVLDKGVRLSYSPHRVTTDGLYKWTRFVDGRLSLHPRDSGWANTIISSDRPLYDGEQIHESVAVWNEWNDPWDDASLYFPWELRLRRMEDDSSSSSSS